MLKLELPEGGHSLLLHACCAPCSGAIVECLLENGIRPAVFFSNANIEPLGEYEKRRAELERYAAANALIFIDDDYDHGDWLCKVASGREDAPERGVRCLECFRYRLARAARYASDNGYDVLTTTLASSRWKDLSQVNEAGEQVCSAYPSLLWWGMNWRKGGLQERRSRIIREQQFYNQLFCGCEFSKNREI